MFHHERDASKAALVALVEMLKVARTHDLARDGDVATTVAGRAMGHRPPGVARSPRRSAGRDYLDRLREALPLPPAALG